LKHEEMLNKDTGLAAKNNDYPTDKFYPCYSPRILTYLLSKGFKPYASFVNIKTLKTCHLFAKENGLDDCIAEVSNLANNVKI